MKKYLQISNDIRNKILNGTYKSNDQLPFEKDLCEMYEASKMTVKKALDILVSEGLIIKRRGSGTYVKDLGKEELEQITIANQFRGLTSMNPSKEVKSKIITFNIIPCPDFVKDQLNIEDEDQFVYDVYRVRYIDDTPTVVEKMYMPINVISGITKNIIEHSIYEHIEDQLGLKIQSAHRSITTRKCTEEEARFLQLQEGDPVAVAEQIGYLDNGTAFEYSISVHRFDRFKFKVVLTR